MTEIISSGATVHARKALEDQIDVHARAIIDIKTRLNTMTPVARLPPELLSTIFTLLSAESYEATNANPLYTTDGYHRQYWIRVAHVCRHWRAIALATPRFWSYIVVTTKRAADELLARSKKAPLHVVASVPSYEDDRRKAVQDVMAEFSRIRALQLSGTSQAICELFSKITAPAPMLEYIKLSERSSYYSIHATTVPLALRAEYVPRLRNVEIYDLPFAWDHPVFSSTLTSLTVCGRANMETRPFIGSFETFLSTLEKMTELQKLVLDHAVPKVPSGLPSRKIPLMRLSSLRLCAGDAECRYLLDHLILAPNVRFHISIIGGVLGPANLFLALQSHLAPSAPMQTACIEETWLGSGRLSLRGWRDALQRIPFQYEPGTSVGPADIHLETLAGGDRISPLLRSSTVFAGVTTLDIRVDGPAQGWKWNDVFVGMPNIRCLYVSRDQDEEFLDALSHTNGDDPATLALRHLEVLKLDNMRLLPRDYDSPPHFLDFLIDALIKRCNYGFPLQELHITECLNTFYEDVARIEEIVPEVVWDGLEEAEDTEEEEEDMLYDPHDIGYGYGYDEDDLDEYELDADDLMGDEDIYFGGFGFY